MNKQEINLIGGGFSHSLSSSGYEPIYIKWLKSNLTAPISIYVDNSIKQKPNPSTKNYAWLAESKTIIPEVYDWAKSNINYLKRSYIKVFTHDVSLSTLDDIFQLTNCSMKSFIETGKVYNKTKLVSMIASDKVDCKEHLFRKKMINKFSSQCDHYGIGYNFIKDKVDGLKDYCFSITMENATYPNMITEKITDCFMTGTIPIYYGINNIGDYFDSDGIITLDDNFKIEELNFDLYESKLKAVHNNFKMANEMLVAEDYIYKNFIRNDI